jgi:hypothetical protein
MEGKVEIEKVKAGDKTWHFMKVKLSNMVIEWLNRSWEVKVSDDVTTPKFVSSSEKVVLHLPESMGGGGGETVTTYYVRNGVLVTYDLVITDGPTEVI